MIIVDPLGFIDKGPKRVSATALRDRSFSASLLFKLSELDMGAAAARTRLENHPP
jgi:hypothetical protein